MTLATPEKREWLARFTGVLPAADGDGKDDPKRLELEFQIKRSKEETRDQSMKEVLLERVRKRVEVEKKGLREAFVFDLKLEGKQISTMGKGGDQTGAFDTEEAGKLDAAIDEARKKSSYAAMGVIVELKEMLLAQTTTRTSLKGGKLVEDSAATLFTPKEVMDELYTPLVRELVVPENFVPKEFSRVQKMLDDTSELYLQDLEKFAEKDELSEGLGDAKTLVGAAGTAAKAIMGIEIKSEETAAFASSMTDLATALFSASTDTVVALRQRQGAQGVQTVVGDVSSALSTAIAALTGNKELAALVASGMQGAVNIAVMVEAVTADEPTVDVFIDTLGKSLALGVSTAFVGEKDDKTKALVKELTDGMKTAFSQTAGAIKGKLKYQLQVGDWGEASKVLASATIQAVRLDFVDYRRQISAEASEEEQEEIGENAEKVDEMLAEAGKGLAEFFEQDNEALKERKEKAKAAAEKKQEELKEQDDKLKKKESDDVEARMEKEQAEYQRSLERLGGGEETDEDLKSIAKLIADLKKQRTILLLASSMGNVSFAVASQFFAPMAVAGTAVQFLNNLASAIERGMALRKWVDAKGESVSAVSPYKTAIENFIRNQAEQFSHYTLKSAINLLKMGGQIATSTVIAAHVGKVVEAGAALAETMEDVTYKFYQKGVLKSAWNATKAALEQPNNRKLGLIARRQNPTLAKYGIAYGAVIEKDSIAISAMNKCGLDRETLSQKSSGVGEVKKYLETLYPDDLTVLGEFTPPGWAKSLPAPALTVKSWMLAYKSAKTGGHLGTPNPPEIVGLLKQVEAPLAKPLKELSVEQLQKLTSALNGLSDAWSGFRAVSEVKVALPEAQKLVDRFALLAASKLADATSELSTKEAEAQAKQNAGAAA